MMSVRFMPNQFNKTNKGCKAVSATATHTFETPKDRSRFPQGARRHDQPYNVKKL